jgi:hypothetical protein
MTRGIYIQGCARSGNTLIRELCGSAFRSVELVKLTKDTAECSLAHLVELLRQPAAGVTQNGKPAGPPPPTAASAPVRVASRNYENSLAMDRELLRANPEVKVLWMLRDPRDILTSIHANQPDKYYVPPDRLIKSLQLYLQFKDEPQVLAVRYEELVGNPDAMQTRISQAFGLAESRKFVEAYKFFPRFHENVRAMHSIRPIDTNSVQKWRSNPAHQKHLQEILAGHPEILALSRDCGYDLSPAGA